jgi:hypothetical protein
MTERTELCEGDEGMPDRLRSYPRTERIPAGVAP